MHIPKIAILCICWGPQLAFTRLLYKAQSQCGMKNSVCPVAAWCPDVLLAITCTFNIVSAAALKLVHAQDGGFDCEFAQLQS